MAPFSSSSQPSEAAADNKGGMPSVPPTLPSGSSSSSSSYVSTYVAGKAGLEDGWKTRVAVAWNDLVHMPVVEEIAWYGYWVLQLLLGPLYAASLLLLFLRDCCSGMMIPKLEEPRGRAVLVTGCDSGFGRELALALYERGWRVYAACLTDAGANDLAERCSGPNMVALCADVTKEADVQRVVARVAQEAPGGLYALVNNAGIGRGAVVDWMPMGDFRAIFEVNFFAMVAMTKACLPLLKECPGARVVNVTSFAGLFYGQPCMAAYCASKHAAESFSTSLRHELKGWGIKVVTVSPSFHKTPIAVNGSATLQRAYDNLTPEMQAEYGPRYLRACKSVANRATKSSWHPENVVKALVRAATASNPRTQYVVGGDAKFLLLPLLSLPAPLVEELVHKVLYTRLVPARVREAQEQAQAQGKKGVAAAAAAKGQQQQQRGQGQEKEGAAVPIAG